MKFKIALIINSTRRLNKQAKSCVSLMHSTSELEIVRFYTQHEKHAFTLAQNACIEKCNVIVAVGGDGTCNEVINGILTTAHQENIRFGVIPNGTGNDFLKNFCPFEPERFVENILNDTYSEIDAIEVKSANKTAYSLNIAGIGFDGHVVQVLSKMRKSKILGGKMAYVLAILKTFVDYKRPQVSIQSDSFSYQGTLLFMAVCNGKAFGHGLNIHPNAQVDDGQMSITILGDVSILDYLRNVGKLKQAKFIKHPEVQYLNTKSISITVKDQALYSEMDGEYFDQGDLHFKILPKSIRYLA